MNYSLTLPNGRQISVAVLPSYNSMSRMVAGAIFDLAHARPSCVLGLATGSTPVEVYAAMVRQHALGLVDFSGVASFNLDEYYPMPGDSPYSYHAYMRAHLFDHVRWGAWHVPNGEAQPLDTIAQECRAYEAAIAQTGGIDLQLLGIGRTGHIGFNEPNSSSDSRTRLVELSPATRQDAAASFGSLAKVPRQAVSMGLGTIFEARRIVLAASGGAKAEIIRQAFCEPLSSGVPASLLQDHPCVELYLDTAAAAGLSDALTPTSLQFA